MVLANSRRFGMRLFARERWVVNNRAWQIVLPAIVGTAPCQVRHSATQFLSILYPQQRERLTLKHGASFMVGTKTARWRTQT